VRYILLVLMLMAAPVWAEDSDDIAFDEARAMIYARDIDGFRAAITAAHAADLAEKGDQNRQRALFGPFGVTDPRVAAFTADWLAAEPDSPYALTARAWYLRAMGVAMRGSDLPRFTWPDAMDEMAELHGAAMEMAMRARDAAPDLVAASDAVIRVAQAFGAADLAEEELARIMAIAPNHGSLTRASNSMAPKWGGSVDAIVRSCEDYATLLPDVDDYTVDICLVEMITEAPVRGVPRDWVWDMLTQLPDHPNLLAARMEKAVGGHGSAQEKIAALEAYLDSGGTNFIATWHLDIERTSLDPNADGGLQTYVIREFAKVAEALSHNGGNPTLVEDYLDLASRLDDANQPEDLPIEKILHDLLAIAPYNANAWAELARRHAADGEVEHIRDAAPFASNAIAYSNHKPAVISQMINTYDWNFPNVTDAARRGFLEGLAAGQSPEFVTVVACPYVRMARVLLEVCAAQGLAPDACRGSAYAFDSMQAEMAEITSHGLCQTERNARIADLRYTPAPLSLTPIRSE
jgi:hypothetical protein